MASRTIPPSNILRLLLRIVFAVVLSASAGYCSTTTETIRPNNNGALPKFPLMGIAPYPFVQCSPLIVGVVCKDGVLLLALHSIFSMENSESSLLPKHDKDPSEDILGPQDLPTSYRGPFRIHPVDASRSMAIVCAGWRTDCQNLVNHMRSIDRREQLEFGDDRAAEYASSVASRASLMLAKLSTSERRRPLSCLGLLASGSSLGLWMVDATGAYRVRGLAVGKGSDRMNEILRQTDWTQKDSKDVQKELLRLLFPDSDQDKNDALERTVPKGSCVEMALVERTSDKVPQKLKRLLASI